MAVALAQGAIGSSPDSAEVSQAALVSTVEARVASDLRSVSLAVEVAWTSTAPEIPLALGADRFRAPPASLPPADEPLMYRWGFEGGGFSDVRVELDGEPVSFRRERLEDGSSLLWVRSPGRPCTIAVRARLDVPRRYGPFGVIGRQLTLGGRWYPQVGAAKGRSPPRGRVDLKVQLPAGASAVVASTWVPWLPESGPRWVHVQTVGGIPPLLVLPPESAALPVRRGAFISPRGRSADPAELRRRRAVLKTIASVELEGPLLIVEAPLRRELARGLGAGVVLVSDHAFRGWPLEDLDRFERQALLRALFFASGLRRSAPLIADFVAAARVDRWLEAQAGAPEASELLGPFSFVPAVDSLLYAPQIPFREAYFRVLQEEDPLRASLTRFPSGWPRGKILYEKLVDRVGTARAFEVAEELRAGAPLAPTLAASLRGSPGPGASAFLRTWLGPYPEVAYRLGTWGSENMGVHHRARVEIERRGAEVAEPVMVRLEDAEGRKRVVRAPATSSALRVITATLSAPLSSVTLDPDGRLVQTPALGSPNPRLDDRSHPGWRVLLNSFNILVGATGGTLDTGLSLSFARQFDPTWAFGLAGNFAPDAFAVTGQVRRAFGRPVTPNRRSSSLAWVLTGERLREGFVEGATGAWAARTSLRFGYDDRITSFAPEAGTGLRARLTYARILARDGRGRSVDTDDALAIRGAVLRSVRVGHAHTFSVRARVDAWVLGRPRPQLAFDVGGRFGLRGYRVGEEQGRLRTLLAGEWVHPLLRDAEVDGLRLVWADRVDGALFAEGGLIADELEGLGGGFRATVGYGFRAYLDYLGLRPGVLAIDVAFPLVSVESQRFELGAPEVWLAFSQSFLSF